MATGIFLINHSQVGFLEGMNFEGMSKRRLRKTHKGQVGWFLFNLFKSWEKEKANHQPKIDWKQEGF